MNIKPFINFLKYLKLLCKHKYYVFVAGIYYTKAPLFNLIIHDMSKILYYSEYKPYMKKFILNIDDKEEFKIAVNNHKKRNKHHWEYWVYINNNEIEPLVIPKKYVKEMIADWIGATTSYNNGNWPDLNNWEWFEKNFPHMRLHEETRWMIYEIMQNLKYRT